MDDIKQFIAACRALSSKRAHGESEAGYALAVSTHRFSRRAKTIVDDKLAFSATLLRAGETDAAGRLLVEAEHDFRSEQAALLEQVNEVKVTQSIKREHLTRVALARMVAVALTGCLLMGLSTLGMVAAGYFRQRPQMQEGGHGGSSVTQEADKARAPALLVELGGSIRKLRVDPAHLRPAFDLQGLHGQETLADASESSLLEDFMAAVLPSRGVLIEMQNAVAGAARRAPRLATLSAKRLDLLRLMRKAGVTAGSGRAISSVKGRVMADALVRREGDARKPRPAERRGGFISDVASGLEGKAADHALHTDKGAERDPGALIARKKQLGCRDLCRPAGHRARGRARSERKDRRL